MEVLLALVYQIVTVVSLWRSLPFDEETLKSSNHDCYVITFVGSPSLLITQMFLLWLLSAIMLKIVHELE